MIVRVPLPLFKMAPPLGPEFPERVELVIVVVPWLRIPPPPKPAVLPEIVELITVRLLPELLRIPPPPCDTVLPEIVELVTVRVPELSKAPPSLMLFAPETITPEMVKLPPVSMVKILKPPRLPLLPLMVSEEALGPVMVTVPAVPPVIAVLASMMAGNAAVKAMVPVTPVLKTISSLPGVVLARVIAASRDPAPEAAVFRTVMVAGTTLSSSPRSSS